MKIRWLKMTIIIVLSLILILIAATVVFLNSPRFGSLPSAEQEARFEKSNNYREGNFRNIAPTTTFTEGVNTFDAMWDFLFGKRERLRPSKPLPHVVTDLFNLEKTVNQLIWFGHSSYFIQIDGIKVLVDPVFSGSAGPLAFMVKAFEGSDVYKTRHIPKFDYLIITHDHWDHLDYQTILELKGKYDKVITGLGVGAHLLRWGVPSNKIVELDWWDEKKFDDKLSVVSTPARHFSGRGLQRNKSLWSSFVLQTASHKVFIGGDGGYGSHFKDIGHRYGPFDLAILENGQYGKNWRNIHMFPEDVVKATAELRAKALLPVHSGKFVLSVHPWDEPLKELSKYSENAEFKLLTPKIGEQAFIDDTLAVYTDWWSGID